MGKLKRITYLLFVIAMTSEVKAQLWKPLNDGLAYAPLAITSERGELYAVYTTGLTEKGRNYGLSVWNGSFWRSLPGFTADSISTITRLKFYRDHLYIAGKFRSVSGLQNAVNIIRWNGKTYESITPKPVVAPSTLGIINDLEVFDDRLIIGGEFYGVQEVNTANIVAYNGEKFMIPGNNFGLGPAGSVLDMVVINDTLVVGGGFGVVSGEPSQYIAAYTGNGWLRYKTTEFKITKMVAQGRKIIAYALDSLKNRQLVQWNQGKAEIIGKGIEYLGIVYDMMALEDDIYASGLFEIDGESNVQTIVRYRDNYWQTIPLGNIGNAKLLTSFRGELVTAGGFASYGNITLNKIACYDEKAGYISGRVFHDKNSNCVFDNRDELVNDRYVIITPGPYILKLDAAGYYKTYLPPGKYSIQLSPKKYWKASTGCPEIRQTEISTGKMNDGQDFAQQIEPGIKDVRITLTNSGGWQTEKGRTNLYILQYENLGSDFIPEGKIKLLIPAGISTVKSIPEQDSLKGGRYIWNYKFLNSGEQRKIALYVHIPSTFEENKLQLETEITGLTGETSIVDNTDTLHQNIQGSPKGAFVKQSYPAPQLPDSVAYLEPGERDLDYTISFRNFSSDTVRTVYVIDTLDLNLAMEYTQETGASHTYTTKIVSGPPGSNLGILIWTFNNINLKPNPGMASDYIGDQGFISFKVKLKDGLSEGTSIHNKASIIFDTDEYHETNTTSCKIFKTVGIEHVSGEPMNWNLYPNPFQHTFTLESESSGELSIYTLNGKKCFSRTIAAGNEVIDGQDLPVGMLLIRFQSENGVVYRRMIKTN